MYNDGRTAEPTAAPANRRDQTLRKQAGNSFLPGSLAEWTGLYLFAVGVYGSSYRGITRHLLLWGHIPLDGFYLTLIAVGGVMMLAGSGGLGWLVAAPGTQKPGTLSIARLVFALSLLGVLLWFTVYR